MVRGAMRPITRGLSLVGYNKLEVQKSLPTMYTFQAPSPSKAGARPLHQPQKHTKTQDEVCFDLSSLVAHQNKQ